MCGHSLRNERNMHKGSFTQKKSCMRCEVVHNSLRNILQALNTKTIQCIENANYTVPTQLSFS